VSEFAFAAGAVTPRKRPAQRRSRETVAAIIEATIRVLADDGAELTTTRVAELAGVSVGTLYQYFPNREALINGVLADHLEAAIGALEVAVDANRNEPLPVAAERVVRAFLAAKARNAHVSRSLQRVIDRIDERPAVRAAVRRAEQAIATLLTGEDAAARASLVCTAIEGIVRAAISEDPDRLLDPAWVDRVVALVVATSQT
jgi:AcrR family transcriptional regulator